VLHSSCACPCRQAQLTVVAVKTLRIVPLRHVLTCCHRRHLTNASCRKRGGIRVRLTSIAVLHNVPACCCKACHRACAVHVFRTGVSTLTATLLPAMLPVLLQSVDKGAVVTSVTLLVAVSGSHVRAALNCKCCLFACAIPLGSGSCSCCRADMCLWGD
jgi:hypothetical protein